MPRRTCSSNGHETSHRKQLRMIVQVVTSKHGTLKDRFGTRKRCTVVLSQHRIMSILSGLVFANIIVTITHLKIYNKLVPSQSHDADKHSFVQHFPRIIFYHQENSTEFMHSLPQNRNVIDMGNVGARKRIALRDELDLDIVEDDNCKVRQNWQKTFFPTCNDIHEFDGTNPWLKISNHQQKQYRIIGHGFWRDVWIVNTSIGMYNEKRVLKTMRYLHDYTPRNFDRMRRDSVTMERLTKSPFIVNVYSFCGTSSLSEYGDGGDIQDALWPKRASEPLSWIQKLRIATQAAVAVASLHNFDEEGYPTVAHTDIAPAQFIKYGDIYKLNDFNRARFISYDGNTMCPYSMGRNPGKNRSPEEYNYEPQTEKVDVYSLGNIFYMLLQGEWPFYDVPQSTAYELVKNGTRPSIYSDLWFSDDPVVVALKEAMIMCHEHDASSRPSARVVERFLKNRMNELDHGKLESWGISLS